MSFGVFLMLEKVQRESTFVEKMKQTPLLLLIAVFTVFVLIVHITSSSSHSSSSDTRTHQQQKISSSNGEVKDKSAQTPDHHNQHEEDDKHITTAKLSMKVKNTNHNKRLLNGVILYLYGGRWHDYFVDNALPRLDEYFVSCYPYPVLVFHEDATEKQKNSIIRALPKGQEAFLQNRNHENDENNKDEQQLVRFDDVSSVWKNLPSKISESKLKSWLADPVQKKFQGRGYRVMCRFWAGLVWLRQSLDEFEYYWRLDTDSILTRPVLIDPFRLVFVQKKCVYGFNRLKGENPHVATKMFETFKKFLKNEVEEGHLTNEQEQQCIRFVTIRSDVILPPQSSSINPKFWAPMYYNNFEMGTMKLKRSEPYQRFFKFVDEQEPFGIFRYRWGDAPLHTLGILIAEKCSTKSFCNVTFNQVPYRHAVTRIPPLLERKEKCQ